MRCARSIDGRDNDFADHGAFPIPSSLRLSAMRANIASDIFAKGMACVAQPVHVFLQFIARTTPIERLVLGVAFAESVCDFGLSKLRPQIKRMRGIRLDAELGKQGEGIARNMMTVA